MVMLSVVPPIALGSVSRDFAFPALWLFLNARSQFFYGRYLKRLSNRTQEALGEMSQKAQESLSALRTVQAFNARSWEEREFQVKVRNVLELGKKEAWASAVFFGEYYG